MEEYQRLSTRGILREPAFHSDFPVVGFLIARFREAWNSISTKWYVRPLVQQQNEFNALVVQRLDEIEIRLVELDREKVTLRRDLAELALQVTQMNRLLITLNEHLVEPREK